MLVQRVNDTQPGHTEEIISWLVWYYQMKIASVSAGLPCWLRYCTPHQVFFYCYECSITKLWISLSSTLETRWGARSGRKSRAASSQMRWFENPPRRHPGEVFQTCPNGDRGVRCLCCGPRTRWEIRSLGCLVNTSLSPQTSWRRRLGGARSRLLSLDCCSCNCSHTWQFGCT